MKNLQEFNLQDFQLSKTREKFGHIVLTFKYCQGQLALFPRETTCMSFSDKVREKLSDMINSCSLPWKWSKLPLSTW